MAPASSRRSAGSRRDDRRARRSGSYSVRWSRSAGVRAFAASALSNRATSRACAIPCRIGCGASCSRLRSTTNHARSRRSAKNRGSSMGSKPVIRAPSPPTRRHRPSGWPTRRARGAPSRKPSRNNATPSPKLALIAEQPHAERSPRARCSTGERDRRAGTDDRTHLRKRPSPAVRAIRSHVVRSINGRRAERCGIALEQGARERRFGFSGPALRWTRPSSGEGRRRSVLATPPRRLPRKAQRVRLGRCSTCASGRTGLASSVRGSRRRFVGRVGCWDFVKVCWAGADRRV